MKRTQTCSLLRRSFIAAGAGLLCTLNVGCNGGNVSNETALGFGMMLHSAANSPHYPRHVQTYKHGTQTTHTRYNNAYSAPRTPVVKTPPRVFLPQDRKRAAAQRPTAAARKPVYQPRTNPAAVPPPHRKPTRTIMDPPR